MAQGGLHALVGVAARKAGRKREWLLLGILLGSLFPDLDNYAVAVATLAKLDTHNLHRTFSHSLLAMLAALVVFFIVAIVRQDPRWNNLGLGFAAGMALHALLDLVLWFNGVNLFWPLDGWVNLWAGVTPPEWFARLMDPAEFLFHALWFAWLAKSARLHHTDVDFLGKLRGWTLVMLGLLVVFTPLAYWMGKGFLTLYGAFYLLALTASFVITIRMRRTVEAVAQAGAPAAQQARAAYP